MSRLAVLLLLAAVSLFPGLAVDPARAAQPEGRALVLCTTDAHPLTNQDQTGQLDRLLKEAFRRAGQRVVLSVTPSERGLINANTGVADGDANRVAGLEKLYPNLVRVAEPNMAYEFVAFVRRPLEIGGWESLAGLRVGFIGGWKILEENVRAAAVLRADSPDQLFDMLLADRVDVVLYERTLGLYRVRARNLSGVRVLEPPLARREMHTYLNVRHTELAHRLSAVLRAMKADGGYAAIMGRRP